MNNKKRRYWNDWDMVVILVTLFLCVTVYMLKYDQDNRFTNCIHEGQPVEICDRYRFFK